MIFKSLKSITQHHFLGTCFTLQTVAFNLKKKKKKWLKRYGYICYIWVSWLGFLRRDMEENTVCKQRMKLCLFLCGFLSRFSEAPVQELLPWGTLKAWEFPEVSHWGRLLSFTPSPAHPAPSTASFCVPVVPPCIPELSIPFLRHYLQEFQLRGCCHPEKWSLLLHEMCLK